MAEQFASDNYAGICPEALEMMVKANAGHEIAYGDDSWTAKAVDTIKKTFEKEDSEVHFVFNGTAANSLVLSSVCRPYQAVICGEYSHIETDECSAPGFFSGGTKNLIARTPDGKLTPELIEQVVKRRDDVHSAKPKAVSIAQSTETGLVYTIDEVKAISKVCKQYGLKLHMDGARFANACAALNCTAAEITWKAGVDVLCLGGSKNGMALGEAVIFFTKIENEDFDARIKQAGQLASKMRFLTAPWIGMLTNDVWLKNARHSNQCAQYFASKLRDIPEIKIILPVEANAVFASFPPALTEQLHSLHWHFYEIIESSNRFMFAWDSTTARIDEFVADIRRILAK
ncbi:threonine aldolase GLY1 [Sugiyamaella lignohabitans]|uniref:Threonine aldolase GLY1 n=1 Tax=Sugiyamaella lignohabitans TaxID=796027 RepID=A0A167DR11_9ASCO|nr:threonine aldolase GLY1 [Sugiyamaella lignohabitans]ANB13189.1 threonine aldolase GLY1 [Sugiyamaella lignohabitans]